MNWDALVEAGCAGRSISREDALALLTLDDAEVPQLVAAAGRVRRHFFDNRIRLNYLVNLKSGLCPEDCHYCSQSRTASSDILRYTWLKPEAIKASVDAGVANGAATVCIVASGRGPSDADVERVAAVVADIHAEHPDVKICTCLGFLDADKATRLREAGASRYNHNLNTAEDRYGDICSTHTFTDRVQTVKAATEAGLSSCSGLIAGMGESDEQLVDVAFALRDLAVDSVPVNFLLPFEGTPLESHRQLTPQRCLKILAMVRFVHPDAEVRLAAGREYHLRTQQPLALEIVNSIFLGDYLTSEGQSGKADLAMLEDGGYAIEGRHPDEAGLACTGGNESFAAVLDAAGVPLRKRGVGTELPANA